LAPARDSTDRAASQGHDAGTELSAGADDPAWVERSRGSHRQIEESVELVRFGTELGEPLPPYLGAHLAVDDEDPLTAAYRVEGANGGQQRLTRFAGADHDV
jgi:hypothetical protein